MRRIVREPIDLGDAVAFPLASGGLFLIDREDVDVVSQFNWSLTNGYPSHREDGHIVYLHRLLLPTQPPLEVDHINRVKCDARRANLRRATRQQQAWNMAPSRDGCRGVYLDKRRVHQSKPWVARIHHQGETIRLGSFATEQEAGRAVDRESIRLRGEFGYVNFADSANSTALASVER